MEATKNRIVEAACAFPFGASQEQVASRAGMKSDSAFFELIEELAASGALSKSIRVTEGVKMAVYAKPSSISPRQPKEKPAARLPREGTVMRAYEDRATAYLREHGEADLATMRKILQGGIYPSQDLKPAILCGRIVIGKDRIYRLGTAADVPATAPDSAAPAKRGRKPRAQDAAPSITSTHTGRAPEVVPPPIAAESQPAEASVISVPMVPAMPAASAEQFLGRAAALMAQRGQQYDQPSGERSMGKAVTAFNAITGKTLTEPEGWLLMKLLKDVRQWSAPGYHADSAEDGVAYAALMAESLAAEGGRA